MQYINPKTNTVYSGDRAHWTHIPVTSEQPSPYHVPVIGDGEHTGWEYSDDAAKLARTAAYSRIKQGHADAVADLRDRYPQTEREGWHELVADAKDGGGECIERYAAELDVSVEDAISRVLAAREVYRKGFGEATGKLTRLRDQVDAAETVEELESVKWPDHDSDA